MCPSTNAQALLQFAEAVDLYEFKNRVVIRLEMDDYEAAWGLCRNAVAHAVQLADAYPDGEARKTHLDNARRIRLLVAMIAEAQLLSQRDAQVTAIWTRGGRRVPTSA